MDEYSAGEADLSPIKELGDYRGYEYTRPDQTVERCRDAEIVVTNKVVFGEQVINELPKLRLICIAATGMNNVNIDAATARGIEVKNVAGYATESVTEATIGGAIAMLRWAEYYDKRVKDGTWSDSGRIYDLSRTTHTLSGKRWGIIGMGHIGRSVARIAEAFGCTVAYTSTSGLSREESYPRLELEDLLSQADIVSIHAPLTQHTANLIDEPQLSLMKPSAILVNVARGGIVNEDALADALNDGTIAGAVLDVFVHEPLQSDSPLLKLKDPTRILLSPHNGWSAAESMARLVEGIAENIRGFLSENGRA